MNRLPCNVFSTAPIRLPKFAFGLLTFLITTSASAGTLISNLPLPAGGVTTRFAIVQDLGAGFLTPAGTDYSLDSITLQLTVQAGASVAVTLYEGSAAAPAGAALATFISPAFAFGETSPAVFKPAAPFTLHAATNYWIVLDGTGAPLNAVTWDGPMTPVTATGLATFLGHTYDISLPPTIPLDGNQLFGFEVDATAVPEPATWMLAGVAAASVLSWRRPRCRRQNGARLAPLELISPLAIHSELPSK